MGASYAKDSESGNPEIARDGLGDLKGSSEIVCKWQMFAAIQMTARMRGAVSPLRNVQMHIDYIGVNFMPNQCGTPRMSSHSAQQLAGNSVPGYSRTDVSNPTGDIGAATPLIRGSRNGK